MKISACTFRRRPVSDRSGSPSARSRPALHARLAVGDPHRGLLGPVAAPLGGEPVQRPVRHHARPAGRAAPRSSRSTTAWPLPSPATHARICSSCGHQRLPRGAVPVRPGRADRGRPPRRSARRRPRPARRPGPARPPAAASTYRRAVLRSTPARSATVRSPAPSSQPRSTSLTSITLTSRNPMPADLPVDNADAAIKRADPRTHRQGAPGGPMTGNPGGPMNAGRKPLSAVPCSWQATDCVDTARGGTSGGSCCFICD